jgi:hypothetical protein
MDHVAWAGECLERAVMGVTVMEGNLRTGLVGRGNKKGN